MHNITIFLLLVGILGVSCTPKNEPKRVSWHQVKRLKFFPKQFTIPRRGDPVPQARCVGEHCDAHFNTAIRCLPAAYNGGMRWNCLTKLPGGYTLDTWHVTCQGYDDDYDPTFTQESCSLEFTMRPTHHARIFKVWRWIKWLAFFGILFVVGSVLYVCIYNFIHKHKR